MVDKGVCDEGFIWNHCECKCDKSYDVGEYLDYQNCKCRKRLVDKLADECDKNKDKCSSYILYIVLFSIFFTTNVGIVAYFVYYKYLNRNKENVSVYDYVYQTTI